MKTGFFEKLAQTSMDRACLAIIFSLACAISTAQESALPSDAAELLEDEVRQYTVELIVFAYDDSISSGTEVFIPDPIERPPETIEPLDESLLAYPPDPLIEDEPSEDTIPEFGDLVEEYMNEELVEIIAADTINLRVLMPEELTMVDIHEKLVLLDAYKPVMWAGWTQATIAEEATPQIRLRRLGNIGLEFDGVLKLYLSRFLHLVVDITMDAKPVPLDGFSMSASRSLFSRGNAADIDGRISRVALVPSVHYRIFNDRIVKNGDIRYFDHPKFGLVVKITRYEPSDEEQDSEALIPGTY